MLVLFGRERLGVALLVWILDEEVWTDVVEIFAWRLAVCLCPSLSLAVILSVSCVSQTADHLPP